MVGPTETGPCKEVGLLPSWMSSVRPRSPAPVNIAICTFFAAGLWLAPLFPLRENAHITIFTGFVPGWGGCFLLSTKY